MVRLCESSKQPANGDRNHNATGPGAELSARGHAIEALG